MTAQQVAADLRAAAEVLRRDGWTWGAYRDATGCCAIGAVRLAVTGRPEFPNDRTARAVAATETLIGDSLARWNDAPGRTADEVIAALEAAADAAERQAAYDEGRWCGECEYGVVMDPPCCLQGPVVP